VYLLIRHLECTKKFLCLVHALWQNVILQKQAANNRQQAIECVSTHVVLRLEHHYKLNGIQLRNLCLPMKGLLCHVKHVVERLCGRLWLVLHTSSGVLCLVIVVQHICYPRICIIMLDALSQHLLSRMMCFTMEDPSSIVRCKSILLNMLYLAFFVFLFRLAHLLHGHGTRLAPLAALPYARSTKSSVFLIHSGVTSFLPT
jgi:hypothetical protein